MDSTNRSRSTLEAPRRHAGITLEAPKPGAIHNHAPAFSETDFDRSQYTHNEYARAEYVPVETATTPYNRANYQPVRQTIAQPPASQPTSREQVSRNDPHGWRSDPPPPPTPSVRVSTIRILSDLTSTDILRDSLMRNSRANQRSTHNNSALNSARPSPLATTNTSPQNTETWQQAFQHLTNNPDSGPIIRSAIAIIIAIFIIAIGTAILGADLFWIGMLALSIMGAKNAGADNGLSNWTSNILGFIHPKFANGGSLLLFFVALGALSFLMMFVSLG